MASEWIDSTLGDVLTLQRGFDLPAQDRTPGQYPIIASTGEVGTHNEAMVRAPGVVIGRSGSLGGGQYLTHDFWPLNTTLWVKDFKGNDPRFCYYLLKSIDLAKFNVGGAVPTLNRNHIHPHPVRVPRDFDEQRAIAHILGTLDDKIELNRRMNETLEAIAQTIFKSWFVDFDPVHAKVSGEAPESICQRLGLTPDLLALFPDRLVDSELGEIPEGWEVSPLSKVCTRITDGAHASPKSVNKGRPMASVKDMDKWGFVVKGCRHISEDNYQELVRNDCRPLAKDVLIAKDGSYLKHIFVVERDLDIVILSSIAILRPNDRMDPNYLAFALKSENTLARMEQYVSGAVLQRIVLKAFREFPIVLPPRALLDAWSEIIGPLIQTCWSNVAEDEILTGMRDVLLPKLLSGELNVPVTDCKSRVVA